LVHFSDLEFVRTHWKRVFYEEVLDPANLGRTAHSR
jgi:hypothetical protein